MTFRTTSFPGPGRSPRRRRRDERGVAFPSPLVMLSVLAVAMASITFIATRDQAPTERRVDTATIASAEQTPTVAPTTPTQEAKPKPKPEPEPEKDTQVEDAENPEDTAAAEAEETQPTEDAQPEQGGPEPEEEPVEVHDASPRRV